MGKYIKLSHHKARMRKINYLISLYGEFCCICGASLDRKVKDEYSPEYITFEHVIPKAFGGEDGIANIRLAHLQCNQQKGQEDNRKRQKELLC